MRKIMNWMLTSCRACSRSTKRASSLCARSIAAFAAILICGASVFTSCSSNDDNPVNPVEPDLNVAEKIIGKWMVTERDGEPALTNEKTVVTFLSATKAYQSVSRVNYDETVPKWRAKEECDMTIDGNTVTILSHSSNIDKVFTLNIKSIDDNNMSCNFKLVIMKDGEVYNTVEDTRIYRRVTADYSADIIGMWEGHSTGEEGSEFDDGENHRWEYMTDGSFNYFHKVDGQWQISDDDYAYYFVDGNLLCTRWKNAGAGNEEHREWWEIESIEDGVMKWKALRKNADGTTYTATFEMKKIELSPSDYKCSRVEVIYRITSPKTNYTFFEGKYAVKSGSDVKIDKLPTFTAGYHEAYNVTDITTFPVEEAICLHYGIKDGLESYAGDYSLNWEMSYTVTSYNAEGYKLDSQTISDQWSENGKVQKKEDLEDAVKLSYSELHASVAENGMITLSKVNKMHPEKSGIDW